MRVKLVEIPCQVALHEHVPRERAPVRAGPLAPADERGAGGVFREDLRREVRREGVLDERRVGGAVDGGERYGAPQELRDPRWGRARRRAQGEQ